MNLIPTPKPVSLRKRLTLAIVNAVLFTAPLAIAMHMPVNMSYATPEHGAVAQAERTQAERQYDRAMEKCQPLPVGTLPGGAVIDWADAPTRYTEAAGDVSMAFDIAVGAIDQGPMVESFTLCR